MLAPALRFTPEMETVAADEAETVEKLIETLTGIIETVHRDTGHAFRSVHAKSHALLEGELVVHKGLSDELAQGIFAEPRIYRCLMRISTNAGDILPDAITLPRGFAVKILDVANHRLGDSRGERLGERLAGSEASTSQDFVLANGKSFAAASPAAFLRTLKMLAATTDRAEWGKKAVSAVFRLTEKALLALGSQSATLETLGGHPPLNPLGESYFSQGALRFGDHVGKLALVPQSGNFRALRKNEFTIDGRNAVRAEIARILTHEGGAFELRVQLCRDLARNPVEDASIAWPEDDNPYIPVATLAIPVQTSWSEARAHMLDDETAFSPWNGIAAHRPLGGIMRVRKATYEASADRRAVLNCCPVRYGGTDQLPS